MTLPLAVSVRMIVSVEGGGGDGGGDVGGGEGGGLEGGGVLGPGGHAPHAATSATSPHWSTSSIFTSQRPAEQEHTPQVNWQKYCNDGALQLYVGWSAFTPQEKAESMSLQGGGDGDGGGGEGDGGGEGEGGGDGQLPEAQLEL